MYTLEFCFLLRVKSLDPALDNVASFKSMSNFPFSFLTLSLDQYLIKTEQLRGSTSKLLISYVKPHKAVSNTTIGKWCKSVLKDAGIDVTEFTSHPPLLPMPPKSALH